MGRPGTGRPGPGRPKGAQAFLTRSLKEAILEALDTSHPEGAVGYLRLHASENPHLFLALVGKVLPMTVTASADGAPVVIQVVKPW